MAEWDVKDLEGWDEKIRAKVQEFGLSCFDQEFEVCADAGLYGLFGDAVTLPALVLWEEL